MSGADDVNGWAAGRDQAAKQDCTRLHHATLNGMQFKIYKLLISGDFLFNIFALQLTIHHWNCKKTKPWIGELGKTTVSQYMHIHGCECWKNIWKIPTYKLWLSPERGLDEEGGEVKEGASSGSFEFYNDSVNGHKKEKPTHAFSGQRQNLPGFPEQNFNYLRE